MKTFFKQKIPKNKVWKIAKFSKKIKEDMFLRDGSCIFCKITHTQAHHCFYWIEAQRDEHRNDLNRWVAVCNEHHLEIHWCWRWKGKRQEAIEYLDKLYKW